MSNSIARLVSATGYLPNRTYLRPKSGNASSNYSGLFLGPNSVRSKPSSWPCKTRRRSQPLHAVGRGTAT